MSATTERPQGEAKKLHVEYVPTDSLRHADYNPRIINDSTKAPVRKSIEMHGAQDPLIANRAAGREGIIISGNLRWEVMKDMGFTEVPVLFVDIPDVEKEKDLCLRLNKAVGEWDFDLLAEFDESFLAEVGFDSEQIDMIFEEDPVEEQFNLQKELERLNIAEVTVQKGDVYDLPDGSRLMCGDSTIEADMLKLVGDDKIDMVMTDPPYRLDYRMRPHAR